MQCDLMPRACPVVLTLAATTSTTKKIPRVRPGGVSRSLFRYNQAAYNQRDPPRDKPVALVNTASLSRSRRLITKGGFVMLPSMNGNRRTVFLLIAAVVAGCLFAPACAKNRANSAPQTPATPTVTPGRFSTSDLTKLRWIEGTWRGTGDVETPFYERYRFENDSTLAVEGFADEKVDRVSDITRFELKEGQFGNGGDGSRWVATVIDNDSITFEPVSKARNSFVWKRASKDLWQAVLMWPAVDNKPARQRVYRMERWPPAE